MKIKHVDNMTLKERWLWVACGTLLSACFGALLGACASFFLPNISAIVPILVEASLFALPCFLAGIQVLILRLPPA